MTQYSCTYVGARYVIDTWIDGAMLAFILTLTIAVIIGVGMGVRALLRAES